MHIFLRLLSEGKYALGSGNAMAKMVQGTDYPDQT